MNTFLIIWIFAAVVQACFLLYFAQSILRYKPLTIANANTSNPIGVSLIICARNEAHQIEKLFHSLDQQSYSNIEYIFVNDGSTDHTGLLCDQWASLHPRAKVIHIDPSIQKELPGKKYALREGILQATQAYILLTDADCIPCSHDWVKCMVERAVQDDADIVLGYGAYTWHKTLLTSFIGFETLHTLIQYTSYAMGGKAYMGVGRNLLYKTEELKATFQQIEFLDTLRKTSSGDDDLMVSYLSQKGARISVLPEYVAATRSAAPTTIKGYLKQKQRHSSSSKYYTLPVKLLLSLYAFSHFLFWLIPIYLILRQDFNGYSLAIWIILLCLKAYTYHRWKKLSRLPVPLWVLIICDFLWCIYNVILSPFIFFKNKQEWK